LKQPIQGILFDKDGTLLDYHLSWAPINERAAAHASRGDAVLQARLLAAGGLDSETARYQAGSLLTASNTAEIAAAWVALGSPFEIGTLTGDLDALFRAGVENVVPVTNLAAYFRGLKARGLMLGIASSDGEEAIRMTLARFGCATVVDFVAGYDSGFGAKPEAGMLEAFAAQTKLTPAAIAIVGDSWHDMEMGRRAGAGLCIAVLTGSSSREQLAPHADLCLDSILDLEQALYG
jgi:phosphoglycolate phosphatase